MLFSQMIPVKGLEHQTRVECDEEVARKRRRMDKYDEWISKGIPVDKMPNSRTWWRRLCLCSSRPRELDPVRLQGLKV